MGPSRLLRLATLLAAAAAIASAALTTAEEPSHLPTLADGFSWPSDSANTTSTASLYCRWCRSVVDGFQRRADGDPRGALAFASQTCRLLRIERPDVCDGIVERYGPVVLAVVADRLLDPAAFCATLRLCPGPGLPCGNATEPTATAAASSGRALLGRRSPAGPALIAPVGLDEAAVGGTAVSWKALLSWRRPAAAIPGAAAAGAGRAAQRERDSSFFLQLTDIHLDREYQIGAEVECGQPLCCRREDGPGPTAIRRARRYGEYACDPPLALIHALLGFANTSHNLPGPLDFVAFTGDAPPHSIWEDTVESRRADLDAVYSALEDAFDDGTPVYPTVGNHACVPADIYNIRDNGSAWLLEELWGHWRHWLPAGCQDTVLYGGYYTLRHATGLRIVALNSQLYDTNNFWLLKYPSDEDPADQLTWLDGVLGDAADANERAIIIAHIPPGDKACYSRYARRYALLVEKHRHTIMAQLFGHTHSDEFKLFHDTASGQVPTGVAFVAPSVTPFMDHNPAFRVFEYMPASEDDGSSSSASLVNYWQYLLNLEVANKLGDASAWELAYTAREEYGLLNLAAGSWALLAARLETDAALFLRYFRNRSAQKPAGPCGAACRRARLCYVRTAVFADYQRCMGGRLQGFGEAFAALLNKLYSC